MTLREEYKNAVDALELELKERGKLPDWIVLRNVMRLVETFRTRKVPGE